MESITKILNMQAMGLSNSEKHYTEEDLANLPANKLKAVEQEVVGGINEALPNKPTQTKVNSHLDDLDDVLNPSQSHPLDNYSSDDGEYNDTIDGPASIKRLPTASAASTRAKTNSISPDAEMLSWMNRINPNAGADEPELPTQEYNMTTVHSASDVPAVISSAMRSTGTVMPEWHTVNNLPGFSQKNIRGMGRQIFGMFTKTPLEQIQTIANVQGKGPNTQQEVRSVAKWLMEYADDLGTVDLDHGAAIPGYKPDVKEYNLNGVRFHVVRDPMGEYIYAYPETDAKTNVTTPAIDDFSQDLSQDKYPQLREGKKMGIKLTITEAIQFDDIIREGLAEIEEAFGKPNAKERSARTQAGYERRKSAYDASGDGEPPTAPKEKSTLARRIGSKDGGKALIAWMHKGHKLSNEAELEPVPFDKEILNTQFKSHPDDFIIVSASNGVAGIKPSKEYIDRRTAEYAEKGKTYKPAGDSTLPYQIVAFKDNGEQVDPTLLRPEQRSEKEKIKQRMGKLRGADLQNSDNIFALLQQQIGSLRTVWISGFTGFRGDENPPAATGSVERSKMAKRAELKKGPADLDQSAALQTVFDKVRPVLTKLVRNADSIIKSRIERYTRAGNYEGAAKLSGAGAKLSQFLATIDTSGEVNIARNPVFSRQISKALADAAEAPIGSPEFTEYLNAAARGNAAMLKPVLDSFRDNLVGLQ